MRVIWGRDNSVNVQKVLWCCEELGLEYKRVDAGLNFGVVNTPEYRALNPNGLVPTLDEDGFVLSIGLAYVDTNRSYTGGTAALSSKDISSATGVLSVAKSF